jgi:release factor glutamine methyltransferase
LVLKVVEDAKRLSGTVRILDIGCGTGAIGVSLTALLRDAQVMAIDVKPISVSTSNENAFIILGDCNRYQAMLCSADAFVNDGAPFDVIVSNPPYIPEHDMEMLSDDVVRYESRQALCGGTDGMDVVRDIILHSPQWSRPGGVIWMEVDLTHPKLL